MATAQYDPKAITLSLNSAILGAHTVTGYQDGTMIVAERTDDLNMMTPGAQGDTAITMKRNENGTVTITLLQTSPTNAYLSQIANIDRQSGQGVVSLAIKDHESGTTAGASTAKLQKHANIEYSNEATTREWVFLCPVLVMLEEAYTAL